LTERQPDEECDWDVAAVGRLDGARETEPQRSEFAWTYAIVGNQYRRAASRVTQQLLA